MLPREDVPSGVEKRRKKTAEGDYNSTKS